MKYLYGAERPVTEDQLNKLESQYSINFPEPYRQFLRENNGGVPLSRHPLMKAGLFYAVADVPSSLSDAIYEREEDHLIPFAETSNSDPVCFNFADGSIWSNGSLLASNFENFVSTFLSPIEGKRPPEAEL